MAAQHRAVEHQRHRERDHHHEDHRVGNAREDDIGEPVVTDGDDPEKRAVAGNAEAFAQPRYGARSGDLERDAAGDEHHAERGDERRQAHAGHENAVDEAAERAGEDAEHHCEGHGEPEFLHRQRCDDARQRQHRADRQVDAAGDDHAGRTDAQQGDGRHLQGDGHAVIDGEEGAAGQRKDDDQDKKAAESGELLDDILLPVGQAASRGAGWVVTVAGHSQLRQSRLLGRP